MTSSQFNCPPTHASRSERSRSEGYGLPISEYQALYKQRSRIEPLPDTQFWIAFHAGEQRLGSVWVTPLVVEVAGTSPPAIPSAYSMTIALGRLVIHGVRFTTPILQVDLTTEPQLPQIWPPGSVIEWPTSAVVDDGLLDHMNRGLTFRTNMSGIGLVPFKPATELPPGQLHGTMVRMSAPCGKHDLFYPETVAHDAIHHNRYYYFGTTCDCGIAYLFQTESDGVHFRFEGEPDAISDKYEALPGRDIVFSDENGMFVCKLVQAETSETVGTSIEAG